MIYNETKKLFKSLTGTFLIYCFIFIFFEINMCTALATGGSGLNLVSIKGDDNDFHSCDSDSDEEQTASQEFLALVTVHASSDGINTSLSTLLAEEPKLTDDSCDDLESGTLEMSSLIPEAAPLRKRTKAKKDGPNEISSAKSEITSKKSFEDIIAMIQMKSKEHFDNPDDYSTLWDLVKQAMEKCIHEASKDNSQHAIMIAIKKFQYETFIKLVECIKDNKLIKRELTQEEIDVLDGIFLDGICFQDILKYEALMITIPLCELIKNFKKNKEVQKNNLIFLSRHNIFEKIDAYNFTCLEFIADRCGGKIMRHMFFYNSYVLKKEHFKVTGKDFY